jgi:hypothetical protein
MSGWAADPNRPRPITVRALVDGRASTVAARSLAGSRDLGVLGTRHGAAVTGTLAHGGPTIAVCAFGAGAGHNVLLCIVTVTT